MNLNESLEWIRLTANRHRFLAEVKLNVMLTTWEAGYGFDRPVHTMDVVTTTNKFRQMGVIQ